MTVSETEKCSTSNFLSEALCVHGQLSDKEENVWYFSELHGSTFHLSHVAFLPGLFPDSGEHSRSHSCEDISLQVLIRVSRE